MLFDKLKGQISELRGILFSNDNQGLKCPIAVKRGINNLGPFLEYGGKFKKEITCSRVLEGWRGKGREKEVRQGTSLYIYFLLTIFPLHWSSLGVTRARLECGCCFALGRGSEGAVQGPGRLGPGPSRGKYVGVEKCLNKDYLSPVCDCHATFAKDINNYESCKAAPLPQEPSIEIHIHLDFPHFHLRGCTVALRPMGRAFGRRDYSTRCAVTPSGAKPPGLRRLNRPHTHLIISKVTFMKMLVPRPFANNQMTCVVLARRGGGGGGHFTKPELDFSWSFLVDSIDEATRLPTPPGHSDDAPPRVGRVPRPFVFPSPPKSCFGGASTDRSNLPREHLQQPRHGPALPYRAWTAFHKNVAHLSQSAPQQTGDRKRSDHAATNNLDRPDQSPTQANLAIPPVCITTNTATKPVELLNFMEDDADSIAFQLGDATCKEAPRGGSRSSTEFISFIASHGKTKTSYCVSQESWAERVFFSCHQKQWMARPNWGRSTASKGVAETIVILCHEPCKCIRRTNTRDFQGSTINHVVSETFLKLFGMSSLMYL
ncbi:hypothetical protein VP01_2223g2 [Puccinia sorghi]|uniref:Uncharacterized protein n=1 Tax=Puccinia sorghi TaxID=27349 RepID=A0A0L6V9C3_9BASI|nr:hypothetical protein VP01_2223g2 [Puccinia sorghi]